MTDVYLSQFILIEVALVLIALAAARWGAWQGWMAAVENRLQPLSQRPVLCFFALVGVATAMRLAFLPIEPVPRALYHDEFSYLMGADTFMHARLTNPLPPAPLALETIHTNMWPSYQSMYIPGPALLLTLGRLLGQPWVAVMLATALLCGAVYWMASGWVRRGYALAAGVIALALCETMNHWFDNFFCIAMSSLGTALVIGSLPRIWSGPTHVPEAGHGAPGSVAWRSTVPLGVGLVLLLLTRPYEGCCVAVPCVAVLLWKLRSSRARTLALLAACPVGLLSIAIAWLLFYNWRGTGHALLFPYAANYRQYHITGPFLFSHVQPMPAYHNGMLRRFYPFAELPQYQFMRLHPFKFLGKKLSIYYFNFALAFGTPLVLGARYVWRNRRMGLMAAPLLALCGFAVNVVLMAWAPFPQYAAPAFPLLLLVIVFGFVHLRQSNLRFARGLVLAQAMLLLSMLGYRISDSNGFPEPQYVSKDRAMLTQQILSQPGKHLAMVRYTEGHESWQEWVFNGASPQDERLVWARSLSPAMDREVLAAYPGRTVWLVKPDYADDLLRPYQPWTTYPLPEYVAAKKAAHAQ